MSKSKSRQPSKQTPRSDKTGANGAAKPAAVSNKPPVRSSERVNVATEEKQTAAAQAVPSTPNPNKAQTRDAAKYERRQAERQMRYLAQRRARRNKIIVWTASLLLLAIALGVSGYFVYQAHQPARASGTSGSVTPFQEAVYNSAYLPVDNVYCDQLEGSTEHIHAYLKVYINGTVTPVGQGVGIATSQNQTTCFYWIHTHDASGVIHIESPAAEPFTLGQFIDEWDSQPFQSLGFPNQLLLDSGWTIWVNGQPFHGHLKDVPLNAHNIITIAYNSPGVKPDTTYNWGTL